MRDQGPPGVISWQCVTSETLLMKWPACTIYVQKDKRYLIVPEGESTFEYARRHKLTLHSDGRLYGIQGLRWLDPRVLTDKAQILENLQAHPLAVWMLGEGGIEVMLGKLEQCIKDTARTHPPVRVVARKLSGRVREVVESQVLNSFASLASAVVFICIFDCICN